MNHLLLLYSHFTTMINKLLLCNSALRYYDYNIPEQISKQFQDKD